MASSDHTGSTELSPDNIAEQTLEEKIKEGEPANYDGKPKNEKRLRAEFVRQVIIKQRSGSEVHIYGAVITGPLDLGATSLPTLIFHDCDFETLRLDGSQVLRDSSTPRIELRRSIVREVSAEALMIDGDIIFRNVKVINRIDLSGTRIGGRLICHKVTIRDNSDADEREPSALECGRVKIKDDVDLDECVVKGGVDFAGAEIGGTFTCTGRLKCENGVALNGNRMEVKGSLRAGDPDNKKNTATTVVGAVHLVDADIDIDVNFRDAQIVAVGGTALNAANIRVGKDLYLNGKFRAEGLVQLIQARVAGKIICDGSKIRNEYGPAINADRLVATDVYLNNTYEENFIVLGGIRLEGAQLSGELSCTGTVEAANGFPAIFADGARMRDLFLYGKFTGEVSLNGVVLTRQLNCTSGTFYNPQERALIADRLTCGNLYLNEYFMAEGMVSFWGATLAFVDIRKGRFRAETYALDLAETTIKGHVLGGYAKVEGGLSLANAHILGNLDFTGASVTPTNNELQGTVLDGQGLAVDGTLIWQLAEPPRGTVNLSSAKVGLLSDDLSSWPRSSGLNLNGFQFGGLERTASVWERLDWLASAKPFSPEPYEALISIYRKDGRENAARKVAITRERNRYRRPETIWYSRLWGWFYGHLLGYGYSLGRVILLLPLLYAMTVPAVWVAQQHNAFVPARAATGQIVTANQCTRDYPCLSRWAYPIDFIVPILNLHQSDRWQLDAHDPVGHAVRNWLYVATALGWGATTVFIGAFTGLVRKD